MVGDATFLGSGTETTSLYLHSPPNERSITTTVQLFYQSQGTKIHDHLFMLRKQLHRHKHL